MFSRNRIAISVGIATGMLLQAAASRAAAPEEIRIVGIAPGGAGQALARVPYSVQSATMADLENAQTLDLSDFMSRRLTSVNINSAQNNPLQPDVQFRGFTASPLLGLPQGLAVYQNGVRVNEPLSDAVNWDLLPQSAVYGMELIGGSNPVFGLNSLGGALAIRMKDGFTFTGEQAQVSGGSWDRVSASLESGRNDGTWGYYVNLSHFDEQGWRRLSDSDNFNFYGTLGWRDGERSALDLAYQKGQSELIGNGALPVGLAALDRSAVFTAPDITGNDMRMLTLSGSHFITETFQVAGNAFVRSNDTDSFNGDASEFQVCRFAGGAEALFEEDEALEDALEDDLGIELDDICKGEARRIRDYDDLEELIEDEAGRMGLDDDAYEPENLTGSLSGTGVLSDAAINNISRREQQSKGLQGQLLFTDDLLARSNQLLVGYSWYQGEADFDAVLELADLDPLTRSTRGLGTGTFVDAAATDVRTGTNTLSVFFSDTLEFGEELALTLSGRYNDIDVQLRDQSGERPELNGDHAFARFNPAVGLTWNPDTSTTVYGSYSESNRVPTPIELACNEGVFELARKFALAAGEDPDDVDFECRLPNAFLADPPLDDVVTRTLEVGTRGNIGGLDYQLSAFRARNEDDIIFQTTGRSTGLFANVDATRRQGVEVALAGSVAALAWRGSYTFLDATFEDDFAVLSPNHPNADADGELAVAAGDRMPGLPEHTVKLGVDYRLFDALLVGAEAIYNSDQVLRGDEANELDTVGGYTLVNLHASYAFAERFAVFARVSNLFGKEYANFGLLGEDPTEVLPGLADGRPRFVGVGAPRAAWVGIRARF